MASLVENDTDNCTYKTQPEFPVPADDALLAATTGNANASPSLWVYLDVWERHITSIEDGSIREPALGGPDTCTRARVTWQIKALPLTPQTTKALAAAEQKLTAQIDALWTKKAQLEKQFQAATDATSQVNLLKQLQPVDDELARLTRLSLLPIHETLLSQLVRLSNASLAARVDPGIKTEDACVTPPDSKYRGAENQLYRVEIHRGGMAGQATFKWSRDNGSVATVWLGGEGSNLQVASTRGFTAGNWVELSDDNSELLGQAGTLLQLVKVEGERSRLIRRRRCHRSAIIPQTPRCAVGTIRRPTQFHWPTMMRCQFRNRPLERPPIKFSGLIWKTACRFNFPPEAFIVPATTG